ncbi:MAG: HEPN domain-containing protein [Phycisphaerae bacterium]|nr:HEPN domain-containing protein [Phycisphaerae bacterium]
MNREVEALWERATTAIESARALLDIDPDGSASRAYYAAFFGVSALFAMEGRVFTKHTAVAAAVHRDLVKTGRWPVELGEIYSWLMRTRQTGDYGQDVHVKPAEAHEAADKAARILEGVRQISSEQLP